MPGDRKRMTARRLMLEDIVNGNYYKREGFEPNFLVTPSGVKASRVEVVGTVVDTFVNDESTYGALTVDDGSEILRAKFFQDLGDMEGFEEGDIVQIIGKVRKYDDEIYVQPEFMKKRDVAYELLHMLESRETVNRWKELVEEVEKLFSEEKSEEDIVEEFKGSGYDPGDIKAVLKYIDPEEQFDTANEMDSGSASFSRSEMEDDQMEKEGDKKIVLGIIEDIDDGEGAGYSEIIEKSDLSEERVESVINDLLSDGTCYEPKPGKIKKL